MEKKIVILFEVHPVITYERRYDFQTLVEKGYSIDICDLAAVFLNTPDEKKVLLDNKVGISYFSFQSRSDFKHYIKNINLNTFIWSTIPFTAESYWIFKVISKYKYGFICNVDYVFPQNPVRKHVKNYWTDLSWSRISNAILYRTPRKFLPIRKADAVITYGIEDIQRKLDNILYDNHTIVELTNTIDYNETVKALLCTDNLENIPETYILFVDEYIPYHPDGLKLGLKINAERYYSEIESFLKKLSIQLKLPVIIAAHPKSDYKKYNQHYKNMKILQFKTPELIKNAELVVTHFSIAIGMIIVCKRPYIIITTDDLNNSLYKRVDINFQAGILEKEIVNASNSMTNAHILSIISEAQSLDSVYYNKQLSKYKLPDYHPNSNMSFAEIMVKSMKEVEEYESEKI